MSQKLYLSFTVPINSFSDHKKFADSLSSPWNFKSLSRLLYFFRREGHNNFVNKIPFTFLEVCCYATCKLATVKIPSGR